MDFELSTRTGRMGFLIFSFRLIVKGEKSKKMTTPKTRKRDEIKNNFNQ
jgi:hypothetical protein